MIDILLITYELIRVMVDISECIQNLPLEVQWEIGQHLNLYFPLSIESAKAIINKTNYQKYVNHALQRDNAEQLRAVLNTISSFEYHQKYIKKLTVKCATGGVLECLQYLTEQGYHKDKDATYWAASNGHLACLQYLTEQGYDKHREATWIAARNGHLACLQYLTEQGYHKDKDATFFAASNGHLACLQYLTEQGYSKDEFATAVTAKRNGHLVCYEYCIAHGYPT